MAKKAKSKKPAPRKAKPAREPSTAGKGAGSPRRSAKPKPGPRSQPLPGMEQIVNQRLNNLCEAIAERREREAGDRQDDAGDKQAALNEMMRTGTQTYHHAGVLLVRVPGQEKLSVRKTKEDASAESGPLADEGGDETGQGEGDSGEGSEG